MRQGWAARPANWEPGTLALEAHERSAAAAEKHPQPPGAGMAHELQLKNSIQTKLESSGEYDRCAHSRRHPTPTPLTPREAHLPNAHRPSFNDDSLPVRARARFTVAG